MSKGFQLGQALFLSLLLLCIPASAQFSRAKLDSLKSQLRLLELTRADVTAILSPDSLTTWQQSDRQQTFYRDDETVDATYSTGTCAQDEFYFMPSDAWDVPKHTLVGIEIEPKDKLKPSDLGIDITKLKKELPLRECKTFFVYFDKSIGLAIHVWDDIVHAIQFFPSQAFHSKLCNNPTVKKYFASKNWRFKPQPKWQVDHFNLPANVLDIQLTQSDSPKISVLVTAKDRENELMTYNYYVSAGRIIGVGAKVVWDLTDVPPGEYKITAAVDEGLGLRGRYLTRSIRIP